MGTKNDSFQWDSSGELLWVINRDGGEWPTEAEVSAHAGEKMEFFAESFHPGAAAPARSFRKADHR